MRKYSLAFNKMFPPEQLADNALVSGKAWVFRQPSYFI